jgi:hypothetical protein
MKKLIDHLNNIPGRYVTIYRICLLILFIVSVIYTNAYLNKAGKDENNFLKKLNLNLSLKVLDIKPTNNHGYGVMYGEVVSKNVPDNYTAIYKNKYTFCKIKGTKVLFISDYYVMNKNDSIVINTDKAKYRVYRNGKLDSENNLTITTDFMLYWDIEKDSLLNFNTYNR